MAFSLMASSAPCFCASAVFIGIFVCATVQLATFTPLYTPVECRELHSGLGAPAMDLAWINITGTMKKECQNPNPYLIRVSQRSPGQVFIKDGSELKPVGQSNVLSTEFKAHNNNTGETAMEIALPMAEATALLAKPLLQVVSEVHVRAEALPRFFGVAVSAAENKDEVCGFEVRMATQKVGPSRCARTLEELVIPGVDSEAEVSFLHLDEEHLAQQELKKNAAFGSILAISFLAAAASVAVGVRRVRAQGKARDAKLDGNPDEGSSERSSEVV